MTDNKKLREIHLKLQKMGSKDKVIREAYEIICSCYRGKRFYTFINAARYFGQKPQKLWRQKGYMDCIHQNMLLKDLLVSSGQFEETDIKTRWTLYWGMAPHQYLRVRTSGNKYYDLDPWSSSYGITFGDYARWFHTKSGSKDENL
jgi:hypothetical protein